jgi:BMFP domain-containing protein YqiC
MTRSKEVPKAFFKTMAASFTRMDMVTSKPANFGLA